MTTARLSVADALRRNDPLCRQCLLRELVTPEEYARIVTRVKDALSPKLLVDDAAYAQRLAACQACAQLQGGTCMQCGCLVEVRALRKDSHCPPPARKW